MLDGVAVAMNLVEVGAELPPSVAGLLAWSRIFSVKSTSSSYMSKLALACEIVGVSKDIFTIHP